MDRLIYTAMTGASHTLNQQATVSQNLANATTTGYRAETGAFRAVPVYGAGVPTRALVVDSTAGANFASGAIQQTGRDLDVAVQGQGWIAVQLANGGEAYTRSGSLQISPNGVLQTRNGLNVQGDGGAISVPPDSNITVAKDGTVSVVPTGMKPSTVAAVGRIKLVNPPEDQLVKGNDGLFRLRGGGEAPADAGVALIDGALEGSNVNVVQEMVNMITLARQFDMQMKLLQSAENNSGKASQIMDIRG
jgi:flagellar basal-body rod protein FlgF